MTIKIISKALVAGLIIAGSCQVFGCEGDAKTTCRQDTKLQQDIVTPTDVILDKLNRQVATIKTYEVKIEYLFVQPFLFDSQTLRK